MAKRVRLIDIAERLGLTKVSVSKALRDHSDISEETRELVKKTAAEMGYSPNLLARSLSSRRSHTLGAVVPKIAHTFFASVIDAIQEMATEEGYGIVLAVSNESASLERKHIERLLAMRVDGLLVSVSQEQPDLEIYRHVRKMKVPLVFFDRPIEGLGFSSVTVNDREGAYKAVERLIAMGRRRIAHIAGTRDVKIGPERRAGYEEALRMYGIEVFEPWIIEGGFDEQHGYDAMVQLLQSGEIPDAILSATFPSGLGAYGALRRHRPDLLDEIQMATFGEGGRNEFFAYPHLCVRQSTRAMGRKAVEMLLAEITGTAPKDPLEVVLPTEVVQATDFDPAAVDGQSLEGPAASAA